MKNFLFAVIASFAVLACNQKAEKKEDEASKKNEEMKALFEKNLTTLKSVLSAFEKEDMTALAANVSDTASWFPPTYGVGKSTKADWMKTLSMYLADWDSLHLVNPNFLPGVDSATREFDGSVRYYGEWDGVHKSGVHTVVNFYASYDFNKDGKIVSGSEFFDVGGMMNAIKPKEK